ncbi:MAG: VCBS repeat-containing protein [Candidatus Wallbacteria bacterium]|nr:VCBS repeat-containing protein [Candidatus Wallbacteria bacterium]
MNKSVFFLLFISVCLFAESTLPLGMDMSLSQPAVADINGDGKKELIIGTVGGKVWIYDSKTLSGIQVEHWPAQLEDEFGAPPQVITNPNGSLSIGLLGMKGKFYVLDSKGAQLGEYDTGCLNGSYLATGDYNNDLKLDFAFGTPQGKVYKLTDTASVQGLLLVESMVSTNVMSFDWDEDGQKETIVKGDDGVLHIFKNNLEDKKFIPEGLPTGKSMGLMSIRDTNNDMKPSLVYEVIDNSQRVNILKVSTDKNFEVCARLSLKLKSNLLYEDFDGDGKTDLLFVDKEDQVHLLLGMKTEASGYPKYVTNIQELSGMLEAADINNDGRLEVLFASNHVEKEDMTGSLNAFSPLTGDNCSDFPREVGYNNGQLLVNDINGDGLLEVVITGMGDAASCGMPNLKLVKTVGRLPLKTIILAREFTFQ